MAHSSEQKPTVDPSAEATPSLSELVDVEDEPSILIGSAGQAWLKVLVLAALVAAFYRQEILRLSNQWQSNPNWSFGFIIPLFSLYLLYNWRHELRRATRRVNWAGLVLVLAAIAIRAWGIVILKNNWIPQLTIPLMIWGLTLFLAGWRVAWIALVPIFYLALAMPWPDRLYDLIALNLQNFAAKMSTGILQMVGVKISVSASHLTVTSVSGQVHPLTVAEACSGIRSLMAFFALGVAMAFIQTRPWWHRVVLILAGIPIAILCNVLRVTFTSTMFVIDKPEFGKEFMHEFMGMALLIPALLLLFLLSRLMDSLYEEADEPDEDVASAEAAGETNA